jgi:hypothetical protein
VAFDDEITELLEYEKTAMSIIFSEFEGNKFNWHTMQFESPKET